MGAAGDYLLSFGFASWRALETNRRGWAVLGESEGSTEVTSVLMVSRDFSSKENAGRLRARTAWSGLEKFLDFWAEGAAQNLLFVA